MTETKTLTPYTLDYVLDSFPLAQENRLYLRSLIYQRAATLHEADRHGFFTPQDVTVYMSNGEVEDVSIIVREFEDTSEDFTYSQLKPKRKRIMKCAEKVCEETGLFTAVELDKLSQSRSRVPLLVVSCVIVFLAVAAMGVALALSYLYSPTPSSTPTPKPVTKPSVTSDFVATVPDVVGLKEKEAVKTITKDKGYSTAINVKVSYAPSSKETGTVIKQTPQSGTRWSDVHSDIELTVSSGQDKKWPDVKGLSVDEVKKLASDLGVAFDIQEADSKEKKDTVIYSSVAPGSVVNNDTRITIRIASGYNTVPLITGLSYSDAVKAMSEYGFKVKAEYRDVDNKALNHVVLDSTALPERAKVGSELSVDVGQYSAPSPNPSPSSGTGASAGDGVTTPRKAVR